VGAAWFGSVNHAANAPIVEPHALADVRFLEEVNEEGGDRLSWQIPARWSHQIATALVGRERQA